MAEEELKSASVDASATSEVTAAPAPSDEQTAASESKNEGKREEPPEGMSRNAWKRELKKQKWLSEKDERHRYKKQLQKQKKAQRREERRAQLEQQEQTGGDAELAAATEEKEEEDEKAIIARERKQLDEKRKAKRDDAELAPITIVLDCGFDQLMTEKEQMSLSLQVVRCYSENRRAMRPCSLKVTSFGGSLLERFEGPNKGQYKSWKNITFENGDYKVPEDEEERSRMVYLSSDSDETLTELEDNMTYIIGGIVDKGRHKNLCQNKASAQHLRTAKLPITEFFQISGRHVLTTNHVVEIMLKWLELRDWKLAFEAIIPPRKKPGFESAKQRQKRKRSSGGTDADGATGYQTDDTSTPAAEEAVADSAAVDEK
ncbi:hypothetical protein BZA70DRAFT_67105 [Myxozyma melibiosi]|uniref:tRNA (guanine(9)-N1)-methyltransferase n=1 Tax=Myxozyma melibiosi TaxID=54550 RepID=A0ABR1F343_9ASCO